MEADEIGKDAHKLYGYEIAGEIRGNGFCQPREISALMADFVGKPHQKIGAELRAFHGAAKQCHIPAEDPGRGILDQNRNAAT